MQKRTASSKESTQINQTDTQPMTSEPWKLYSQMSNQQNNDTRPSHRIGGRRLSDLLKMIDLSG